MPLKYIAGTLPSIGVYAIVPGLIQRLPTGRWELNSNTVASVDMVGSGKQYNYGAGGAGIVAGGILAGPLGAVVGGLAPKAFKDDVVQFVIRFRNGDVAHFAGSPSDYRRALNSSYKGARTGSAPASAPAAPETEASEVERLRAELAALRAGQEPADEQPAAVELAPPPPPRQRTLEEVRAEMAAEAQARAAEAAEALNGASRLWFAGVAERKYVKADPNETPGDRKQREAQNEAYRKEYKSALQVVKKQHEKEIQKGKMPFKERLRLLNEIQREFTYRTQK